MTKQKNKNGKGKQSTTEVAQRIYIGPNLLGLITYTVVEKELPTHIQSFIDECAEIGKLFVPLALFTVAERKVKEKGSLEHRYYQKVLAFKEGAGK